jgi:hypothetical protein
MQSTLRDPSIMVPVLTRRHHLHRIPTPTTIPSASRCSKPGRGRPTRWRRLLPCSTRRRRLLPRPTRRLRLLRRPTRRHRLHRTHTSSASSWRGPARTLAGILRSLLRHPPILSSKSSNLGERVLLRCEFVGRQRKLGIWFLAKQRFDDDDG